MYIEKTQKVRLGALHDIMKLPGITLKKWPTDTNIADTFTKPLSREPFEKHRRLLCIVPMDSVLSTALPAVWEACETEASGPQVSSV